jgi:hypothetical protein
VEKRSSLSATKKNRFFDIDGRISSRLDYESKQLYNLTVKATDEGSPSLSSVAHFVVEVIDVNENLHPPR